MASNEVLPNKTEDTVLTTIKTKIEAFETNLPSPTSKRKKPIPAQRPCIPRKPLNLTSPSPSKENKTEKTFSTTPLDKTDSPSPPKQKNVYGNILDESPSKIDAKSLLISVFKELQCYYCLSMPRPDSDQRWR